MNEFSFLLIHILKSFWTSIRLLGSGRTIFHIRHYRVIRDVSYSLLVILLARVSISTIWRRHIYYEMERRKHYGRGKLGIQELMDINAEIKFRSVNSGIIMIEGKLAARSLYARISAVAEALVRHDPIGAGLRWRNLTPRVTYNVPGNFTFRVIKIEPQIIDLDRCDQVCRLLPYCTERSMCRQKNCAGFEVHFFTRRP